MSVPKGVPRPDPTLTKLSPAERELARSVSRALTGWYSGSGRWFAWREWEDAYRLTIIELLLQRTRAETVAAFAPSFFSRYPDWQALAAAGREELVGVLRPIGLSGRRAASLEALAGAVTREGLDPSTRTAPGVGQYISRAIAVASRGEPVAMVDSNWVRVVQRVFSGLWMADYRYDSRLQSIAHEVVAAGDDPRRTNWAVLDLGALVCRPRAPRCEECPLSAMCRFALRQRT